MPGYKSIRCSARRAGRGEVDHDVALAVEPARVTHVGVVVGRHVDVVVFGPADALQMNRHRRAGWPDVGVMLDDAGFDGEVRARERFVAASQRQRVQPAEIVRESSMATRAGRRRRP